MLTINELYNLDCMVGIAQFPNAYFDLAIVDPPYGSDKVTYIAHDRKDAYNGVIDKYTIETIQGRVKNKNQILPRHVTSTTTCEFNDDNNIPPPPEYFKELFRVSKNQLIFGGNNFILPPSRGWCVWRKTNVPAFGFSMSTCELIWTSFNAPIKIYEHRANANPNIRFHPTQKPVELYEFLLRAYAKKDYKLLDTHAGSASSLIAARKMGLEFIGFEIENAYYQKAKKRMETESIQMILTDVFHPVWKKKGKKMFLSTTLTTNMLDINVSNATISFPYDFTRGSNHIIYIQPVLTLSRDINPWSAGDSLTETRPDTSGAIVTPNRSVIQVPQGVTNFNANIDVQAVQRIVAGTLGGYGWRRGTFRVQVTCDLIRNILQVTPIQTSGNFPSTRPAAVSLIFHTVL